MLGNTPNMCGVNWGNHTVPRDSTRILCIGSAIDCRNSRRVLYTWRETGHLHHFVFQLLSRCREAQSTARHLPAVAARCKNMIRKGTIFCSIAWTPLVCTNLGDDPCLASLASGPSATGRWARVASLIPGNLV